MPSLPWLCAADMSFLSSLSLLSVFLSLNIGVEGATLREPRLWDDEPNTFRPGSQAPPPPSAAMLQALQYIQGLSKRTLQDPVSNNDRSKVPADDLDDLESIRDMLHLTAPARTSTGMQNGREERQETGGDDEKEGDKAQQWIQAVLSTLQQTEDQISPMKTTHRENTHSSHSSPTRLQLLSSSASEPKQQQDGWMDVEGYGRDLWANQGVQRRHRKFPLMFEDDEAQDQPLKRTNENAEEQYTPQKLATLQSVFEELGRIANAKSNSKRQDTENSEAHEDDDEYRERKMVFDNEAYEEEALMPLEESTEQEKEEKREFIGGFGNEDEEEEDGELGGDEDKRSSQSDMFKMDKLKDPDDPSRLVDYYLMKVLEKTEQEEQKRDQEKENEQEEEEDDKSDREEEERGEEEEEEEEEERRKRRTTLSEDSEYPQSLDQFVQILKKLQNHPEDHLDLLENEEPRKAAKARTRTSAKSQTSMLPYPSSYNIYKSPASQLSQGPVQEPETSSSVTEDILRILGLANEPRTKPLLRSSQHKSAPVRSYYTAARELPDYAFSETVRGQREVDYDDTDTVGEDELASYLAAEILAQRQRRALPVLQDYFDQTSQSRPEQRQMEREIPSESSDEETLLRILNYLNPESEDVQDTDANEQTVPGM